jgi:cytochrome c biogenesis protein CcmG/thiol:disulfide interchange protein DsbE
MKSIRFLVPLAIFLGLVVFLGAGLKLDPKEVPSPLIGKPAPAFALIGQCRADHSSRGSAG